MTCQVITRWVSFPFELATWSLMAEQLVSSPRTIVWLSVLQHGRRYLVCRLYLRGTHAPHTVSRRGKRHGSTQDDLSRLGDADGAGLAGTSPLCHSIVDNSFSEQGHTKLPDYITVGQFPKTPLRDLFTAASPDAINMLTRCLVYEPRRRISAYEVCPLHSFCDTKLTDISGATPSLLHHTTIPHSPIKTAKMQLAACGK